MTTKTDTSEKQFEDQMDGEELLFLFRKHPLVMRKGLIYGALGLLAGPLFTMILTYMRPTAVPSISFFFESVAASCVLAALIFFPSWINWYYSMFIVTNQRLIQITQKGLFHRSVVDMGLQQIKMVNYEIAGLEATLLGFGTITMQTFLGELVIHDVHHPAKIQKKILSILREEGISTVSAPMSGESIDEAENS